MRFLHKGESKQHKKRAPIGQRPVFYFSTSVFLLWLLFFATIFYMMFFSVFFSIGEMRISGTVRIPEEVLLGFTERELSVKYFNIFPKRNFFLMQPRVLEERLFNEYPLLSSADVVRIFPNGAQITVTERKKIILWCYDENSQDVAETVSLGESCFLINEEGIAKDAKRAQFSENIEYVIFITDMSHKPVSIGDKVFDPHYGTFIIRLSDLFTEQLGIPLESRFTTVSRFANEVRAKTNGGWYVYFGTDVPLELSLDALKLLFAKELPPEKRAKLAYIDLRTENRVYYAFREEKNMENKDAVAPPVSEESN